MSQYNIVAADSESTVVAEYKPEGKRAADYQSEAALEQEFIDLLGLQGYEYITVKGEAGLVRNLRSQLEALNDCTFSDTEWERFFAQCIASANEGIVEKTRKIQEDHVQILKRDDSTTKNIYLVDKKCIHNNRLQVLNQYEEAGLPGVAPAEYPDVQPFAARRTIHTLKSLLPLLIFSSRSRRRARIFLLGIWSSSRWISCSPARLVSASA